jgi:hypothetical protein
MFIALALVVFLLAGCAGQFYAFRTVDDFANDLYVKNPTLTQAFYYIPAIPLCMFVGFSVDFAALNPWTFWTKDVWRSRGTAFRHESAGGAALPGRHGDRLAREELPSTP